METRSDVSRNTGKLNHCVHIDVSQVNSALLFTFEPHCTCRSASNLTEMKSDPEADQVAEPETLSIPSNPGVLSRLFFLFVGPIIKHGHRTTLQPDNLYKPRAVLIDRVHGVFDEAWRRELKSGRQDIRRAVVANSLGGIIFTGLLYALSLACQLVGPMMLNRIVGGLQCWARQGGQKGGACPTATDLY